MQKISQWQFYNPVKIFAGRGSRTQLVQQLNNKALLIVTTVRGKEQFTSDKTLQNVIKNNRIMWLDSVKENPELTDLESNINQLQSIDVDAIVAFGGGSAMDAAKAIRMGLAFKDKYTLSELLVNSALCKNAEQVPLYVLSTTAGTGSEVTPFATVWNHEAKKKLSLSCDKVFPTVAITDSELTDTVPLNITISTGLDAINQAAESIWNKNANSITLTIATRSLKLSLAALPILAEGKGGRAERDQMSEASLLAGLAISHTRTALCHSISYPLTAHFGVPHGLACAFTMPEVCKLNLSADDGRFTSLAHELTGKQDLKDLYEVFINLNTRLNVAKKVQAYIPKLDALIALKSEMYNPSRAANNLVTLEESDLVNILKNSITLSKTI